MTASHDNRNNNKRAKKQKKKKNVQHQRQVKGLTNGSRNFGATVKINAKQFMKYLWSVTWLTINIYMGKDPYAPTLLTSSPDLIETDSNWRWQVTQAKDKSGYFCEP